MARSHVDVNMTTRSRKRLENVINGSVKVRLGNLHVEAVSHAELVKSGGDVRKITVYMSYFLTYLCYLTEFFLVVIGRAQSMVCLIFLSLNL